MVLLVGHRVIVRRRQIAVAKPTKKKLGGGGWLALGGLIAAAVFIYRDGDNQGSGSPHAERTLTIPVDAYNACHAELSINGHTFRVVLDSGAAGVPLVFGSNQAAALGFSPGSLSYSKTYGSANGEGREAVIELRDVRLHGWRLGNLSAVITRATQDEGLFGAELLHRLEFRTSKGFCVLTMPEDG